MPMMAPVDRPESGRGGGTGGSGGVVLVLALVLVVRVVELGALEVVDVCADKVTLKLWETPSAVLLVPDPSTMRK
jgi:hypothetical protein